MVLVPASDCQSAQVLGDSSVRDWVMESVMVLAKGLDY